MEGKEKKMNKKIYFVLGVAVFSILGWRQTSVADMLREIFSVFQMGYDGVLQPYKEFVKSAVRFYLPQIFFLLIWGDFVSKNLVANSTLIFSRTRQIRLAVSPYMRRLLAESVSCYILLVSCLCIIGVLHGQTWDLTLRKFGELLGYGSYLLLFLFMVNCLSFFMKPYHALLFLLVMEHIWLTIGYFYYSDSEGLPSWLYYVTPTAPCLWAWNKKVPDGMIWGWIVYVFVLGSICYWVTLRGLKKKEWI